MKGITRLKSFCDGWIFWIIVKVAHDQKIGRNGWIVLQGLCKGGGGDHAACRTGRTTAPTWPMVNKYRQGITRTLFNQMNPHDTPRCITIGQSNRGHINSRNSK